MFRAAICRLQHALPALPYAVEGGIPPVISAKQLDLHYNKHHNAYVVKLNGFVANDASLKDLSLEAIIKQAAKDPAKKGIFNNAAQHYNHSFYWKCLKPNGSAIPAKLEAKLAAQFGSVAEFKKKFAESALNNFGSGWTWVVQNADGSLEITNTSNAAVPITEGKAPVLTCDVWEHAYYVDFLNRRDSYLESFWAIVDWEFVSGNVKY
jgi:Fe-Mn family superoxide dismutase